MLSFVRRFFLSFFILVAWLVSTASANSLLVRGIGAKTDPIQIATCQQLQDISKNLSADYVLANDIDCSDTKNWNSGAGFMPINNFTGTVNGQNYSIDGITIHRPTNPVVGVFATLLGTLNNLNFKGEDIVGLATRPSTRPPPSYLGGVVAYNKGKVIAVSAEGNYSGNAIWVGAVAGNNSGVIINTSGHGQLQGNSNVGGLVGYQFTSGTITNSFSDAVINGAASPGTDLSGTDDAGLVATNDGLIQNSYAIGPVLGHGIAAGGLVGWNQGNGNIVNTYADGPIDAPLAGGLVGLNHGKITNSYSIGKVSGAITGGLLGKQANNPMGIVVNAYYDKETSGQSDTSKGVPFSTAQMYQKATYVGWDFTNIWDIDEGKAYPELKWEEGDGYAGLLSLKTALRSYDAKSTYFSKYGYFEGNTYALGTGNDVRILQTPNIWGKDLTQVHYFNWDGKNVDFGGLPDCTSSANVCASTNTSCMHLNAFYNGITGQDTKRCLGPADNMVDDIYNAMIQAHTSIDITTLEPFPDGRFLAAMRNAITWLAVNDRKVTIRVLGGVDLGYGEDQLSNEQLQAKYAVNDQAFLKALVRDIPANKASNIKLYVGSMRSCAGSTGCINEIKSGAPYLASWNHSKIVDVDGATSIVGGHNWWTNSYLTHNPISDMSLEVQGPSARNAEPFVNGLWNFICKGGNKALKTIADSQSWSNGASGQACLANIPLPAETPIFGDSAVLGIGRLGLGMFKVTTVSGGDEPANQSEVARNQMLSQAKTTIRIAQQNLQGVVPGILGNGRERSNDAGNVYDILAKFLINKGNLYVVTTNYGAKDAGSESYYTKTILGNLADTIKDRVKKLAPTMSKDDINTLLCNAMHLATIQPSTTKTWPDGKVFGNHSKVWITDDQDYYVGSHNIYAANLQEYGYIVGGKTATDDFIGQYWDPLWKYSSATAITGSEVPTAQCYFDVKHPNALQCTGRTVISANKVEYTGCADSNDDTPATFVTAVSTPIGPSDTECSAYQSGTTQDSWTGCGQAELGSQDYTISW
jgi:hypothetical protein